MKQSFSFQIFNKLCSCLLMNFSIHDPIQRKSIQRTPASLLMQHNLHRSNPSQRPSHYTLPRALILIITTEHAHTNNANNLHPLSTSPSLFLPVPSWAMGPGGCLLTELPSLTVLYNPEQSALELTSDCGLDGTKRIACKGNVVSVKV